MRGLLVLLLMALPVVSQVRAADLAQVESAVASSDDFAQYRAQFVKAAVELVDQGKCTVDELKEMGGWVRSQTHKPQPVYFTYCGGSTTANRIYLDVRNGKVFR
jgi:hypothetical protein